MGRGVYKGMSDHPPEPAPGAPRPAEPPRAAPVGAAPADWDALARLLTDEPRADAPRADDAPADAARAAAAQQWMAAHPDEAARLARLDALVVAQLSPPPAAPVDVEAALARVKAALDPASAAPASAAPAFPSAPRLAPLPRPRPDRPRATTSPLHRDRPAWSTRRLTAAAAGAAAVVLLAAVGLLRRPHDRPADRATAVAAAPAAEHRYATRVGTRDSLRLPDGTRVVLGPATRLTVPAGYGRAERTVTLDGEAYFAVARDAARPFTVRAGPAVVRDLGTAFVVRGSTAGRVVVAVTEGLVRLEAPGEGQPGDAGPPAGALQPPLRPTPDVRGTPGNRPRADTAAVLLRAGDRGLVAQSTAGPGRRAAPRVSKLAPATGPADELAWTTGRLVFRDAALPEVADALRRWYGVDVRVTDPALAGRHLTASFQGEPVGEVLRVIGLALGARLDRRGDTVFVRGTP